MKRAIVWEGRGFAAFARIGSEVVGRTAYVGRDNYRVTVVLGGEEWTLGKLIAGEQNARDRVETVVRVLRGKASGEYDLAI